MVYSCRKANNGKYPRNPIDCRWNNLTSSNFPRRRVCPSWTQNMFCVSHTTISIVILRFIDGNNYSKKPLQCNIFAKTTGEDRWQLVTVLILYIKLKDVYLTRVSRNIIKRRLVEENYPQSPDSVTSQSQIGYLQEKCLIALW